MNGTRIGFIGLGAMGLPMARNLLTKGGDVHVSAHRNRNPVEELKRLGAIEHGSPADFAPLCEVLVSILPTDREMESVLLDDRLLAALPADCTLIEMTSGSPGMMKKVHEAYARKGIRVLDAPVSGGTAGARDGTLTVMAGGEAEVLERCRPVLDAMARTVFRVGEVGAGKAVKAINQMLAGIHMIAASEALALARKLGVDPQTLKRVVGSSSGASWMLANKLDGLAAGEFAPGFKLALMKKDVQIAVDEAGDMVLPLASEALRLYREYEEDCGEFDFSIIGKSILT